MCGKLSVAHSLRHLDTKVVESTEKVANRCSVVSKMCIRPLPGQVQTASIVHPDLRRCRRCESPASQGKRLNGPSRKAEWARIEWTEAKDDKGELSYEPSVCSALSSREECAAFLARGLLKLLTALA